MEEEKVNFYGLGLPWIFIQKLTREIIQEAIKLYINDEPDVLSKGTILQQIDPVVFNQLRD